MLQLLLHLLRAFLLPNHPHLLPLKKKQLRSVSHIQRSAAQAVMLCTSRHLRTLLQVKALALFPSSSVTDSISFLPKIGPSATQMLLLPHIKIQQVTKPTSTNTVSHFPQATYEVFVFVFPLR